MDMIIVGNTDPDFFASDIGLRVPYRASVCISPAKYHASAEIREAIARKNILVLQGLVQPPQQRAVASVEPPAPKVEPEPSTTAPTPIPDPTLAEVLKLLKALDEKISMGCRVEEPVRGQLSDADDARHFSPAKSSASLSFEASVPSFIPEVVTLEIKDSSVEIDSQSKDGGSVKSAANALKRLKPQKT